MKLGYCVPAFAMPGANLFRTPNIADIRDVDVLETAREAERLGFDSIWVCDHLMLGRDRAVLEGWTTLAMIAGATSRIRLGLIHQANLFREPAIAAKMMATLDRLSGGRFIHFFEAGMAKPEQYAYGLDWDDDHALRAARLEEAIALIEALYASTGPVDFAGKYYALHGAELTPKPLQPKIPLWLGEAFDPVIELAARRADGWNSTPVTLDELRRRLGLLDAALARAGRSRNELEISFETQILLAPDRASLRAKLAQMVERGRAAGEEPKPEIADFLAGRTETLPAWVTGPWIVGTPDDARARIAELAEAGVQHLMLWFMDAPDPEGMRFFMSEVAPGL
jgi:alkanesulfonate monooxygenase SsuD/methylene tetrahydromethanopterin reductase-like flavin-dependent oxidoreductase (luciferase family)